MVDEEHPTTKSDSQPLKHPYEEPKKENLSGSLTTDEVTIIGNDPRARSPTDLIQNDTLKAKRKTKYRNLKRKPEEQYRENSFYWRHLRLIEFFACMGILVFFAGIIILFNKALANDGVKQYTQIVDSIKVIFA